MQLTHPITHEQMTIEHPAADDHAKSRVVFTLPAHQDGAPRHYHDRFAESFCVLSGELELTVADAAPRNLRAGERLTVPAGTVHAFRNASAAPVTFCTEIIGGRGFERFIRGWYGLAIDGRSDRRGAPRGLLDTIVLLDEGDVNLPGVPLPLQRGLRRALRWLARLTGAERRIARWW